MVKGRGRFGRRSDVEGALGISAPCANGDARLQAWIHESAVILPRLHTMVRNDRHGSNMHVILRALEDLGRRISRLEDELVRLTRERAPS